MLRVFIIVTSLGTSGPVIFHILLTKGLYNPMIMVPVCVTLAVGNIKLNFQWLIHLVSTFTSIIVCM